MYNKIIVVISIITLSFSNSYAQSKQDYHWFFGKDRSAEQGIQGLYFNFNSKPVTAMVNTNALEFDQCNASVSDKDGNLLFYTNGCAIANKNHEIMENGDSINHNLYFEVVWKNDCGLGYPGFQDITILPDPAYEYGYYLIHKILEYNPGSIPSVTVGDLLYSYIDMSNGIGVVTEKNKPFGYRHFLSSYLATIGHINQNDWWIVQPGDYQNYNYIFLLDETGFSLYDSIQIGNKPFVENSSASGQAKFSPDGTKYAFYNYYDGLYLYDFNRENAQFTNLRVLETPNTEEIIFGGMEFSPNSEFVYFTNRDTLFQVDLSYSNLNNGLEVIDTYDGVQDPVSTTFAVCNLGPDCRIYIRTTNGTNVFHVINNPNKKGLACNFVERGIRLPQGASTGSWPNPPRFRVDEPEPCDPSISTFLGPDVMLRKELKVSPNPVSDLINIVLPDGVKGNLHIVNAQGAIMKQHQDIDGLSESISIDVSDLAPGYYLAKIITEKKSKYFYDASFVKL